jgi:hypothetical protein
MTIIKELEVNDWLIHVNDFEYIFYVYTKDTMLNQLTDYKNTKPDEPVKNQIKSVRLIIESNDEDDDDEVEQVKQRLIKSGHIMDGSKHCGQG